MTGIGCGRRASQWKGSDGEGSLANEGTSFRGMDNNFLFLWVCVTGNFGVREYSAIYVFG